MSTVRTRDVDSIAPWAEIVPGVGPMTVADLLDYPDEDGYRYEVVEGVLVRMAGSKPRALFITDRLYRRLGDYVEDHELGQTTGADGVYDFKRSGQRNTGLVGHAANKAGMLCRSNRCDRATGKPASNAA